MNPVPNGNPNDALEAELRAHDERLAAAGLDVWIGAEPTFTDRFSSTAEWHGRALGPTKEPRARRLAARLAAELPDSALLRTLGRRYRGEEERRWSYGLLARRDGEPLWSGPRDPLVGGGPADEGAVARLATALCAAIAASSWHGFSFPGTAAQEVRVLLCLDGAQPASRPEADPRLQRPSVHQAAVEPGVPFDGLAVEGQYLLIVGLVVEAGAPFAAVELPSALDVDIFLSLLTLIEQAAAAVALPGLILRGYPPAVDARLRWSTVTPDPGVIEINQAPAARVCELLAENRRLFDAAASEGLAPYRLHYNGLVDDSGGGGQLSIGGPSPSASPFVVTPQLLPRLVRYLNQHPSLSYWFSPVYAGAYSQAPRPDEGIADLFAELGLALDQLSTRRTPDPEFLWRSLSPFLCDVSGNSHRSELNIEKLWSPSPRADGISGVVELRAFRMAKTPDQMVALAALVRSVVARLMLHPFEEPLVHWGPTLHDRFALPFYLERDLDTVLADLDANEFELGPETRALLRADGGRCIARWSGGDGSQISLLNAMEFWPQVGDTINQPADSRTVDASTARLEVRIESDGADVSGWSLAVNGFALPLRLELGRKASIRVFGIRYRRFRSPQALHPAVEPQLPLRIQLHNAATQELWEVEYHEWRPDGGAYPGLPQDEAEAERRRDERVARRCLTGGAPPASLEPPAGALTAHCFDVRRT